MPIDTPAIDISAVDTPAIDTPVIDTPAIDISAIDTPASVDDTLSQTTEDKTLEQDVEENMTDKAIVEIEQVIQAWAYAWSNQDVNKYLNHYAENFTPGKNGLSKSQWEEQRKARLTKPSEIQLSLVDIEFTNFQDEIMRVTFEQHYKSDTYMDKIIKSMKFVNQNGSWKILSEKTVKAL